jgi:hypothetical protein
MLAFFLLVAAHAPPPPLPAGTPPATIADLVRIEGACSLAVLTVGDDGLSSRFNEAVSRAAKEEEGNFCRRATGNYVIYTNGNVRPAGRGSFCYHVTVHDARDFVARYASNGFGTLAVEQGECRAAAIDCADQAVGDLIKKLEAR